MKDWQVARGYSQTHAARVIGIGQSTFSDYCSGVKVPKEDRRPGIERDTDGAVPAASWAFRPQKRASSRARKRATDGTT